MPRAKMKLIPAVKMASQSPWRGNFRPKKNRIRNEIKGTSNKPVASCPDKLSEICDMVIAAFRFLLVVGY
jgi:hypothetical protein